MEKVIAALMVIALLVLVSVIVAFPIMWLWNGCLVPAIPMLVKITFWQALGIKVLVGLLSYSNTSSSKKD
jgi:hypothetical protein